MAESRWVNYGYCVVPTKEEPVALIVYEREMGVDVAAILSHELDLNGLYKLVDVLNRDAKLCEYMSRMQRRASGNTAKTCTWTWESPITDRASLDEIWARENEVCVETLRSLFFIRQKTAVFGDVTRWATFLTEADVAERLRDVLRRLSTLVSGNGRVIYVPDSMFEPAVATTEWMDEPLDVIELELRKRCGPPAESLSEIYRITGPDTISAEGYFVEQLR